MMPPIITVFKFDGGALTAGLYNNLFYYITEAGDVRVKYLATARWDEKALDKKDNIFPWGNDYIDIASLESFPLDSIAHDNTLAVATIDGLKLLPFKGRYVDNDVTSYPDVRPISINRCGEYIAFSLEKDGLFLVDNLNNATKKAHLKIESDRIIPGLNYALNLFSESVPSLLDLTNIDNIEADYHRNDNFINRPSVCEDVGDILAKNDVIGRDINFAYTDGKCIIFEDDEYNLYAIGLGKEKGNRERVYFKNKPFFDAYVSQTCRTNLITSQENCIHDNHEKREQSPKMLHRHPMGLIEQYMNHVDFIDFLGNRTILFEGEDIAEVRTHTKSRAYQTLITIAAESHVAVANIYSPAEE